MFLISCKCVCFTFSSTNSHDRPNVIPASFYKYEVEQFETDDKGTSRVIIVDYTQIRRKWTAYSRERNKMFLKQNVDVNDMGVWCIKDSVLEEFGIKRIKFDQIFVGPVPDFDKSKKLLKAVNGKKVKQETLVKFLTRTGTDTVKNPTKKPNNNLLEEMRKKQIEYKQKQAEEKLAIKQKRKEDNVKITMHFRDWYKLKEDLELNDQKVMKYLAYVRK